MGIKMTKTLRMLIEVEVPKGINGEEVERARRAFRAWFSMI